jgi:multidrug resistance efflux pump
MIRGATRAIVLVETAGSKPEKTLAHWPEGTGLDETLVATARTALRSGRPVVHASASDEPRAPDRVAVAFSAPGIVGAVAVEVPRRGQLGHAALLQFTDQSTSWLALLLRAEPGSSTDQAAVVLNLVALCLDHERFRSAATAVATELATRVACERVSIGFVRGPRIALAALSHSARFDERSALAQAIEAAMDEAADQSDAIVHPSDAPGPPQLTRAHEELCRAHGAAAVATFPIADADGVVGALTLEYGPDCAPEPEDLVLAQRLVRVVGPILDAKRREDRAIALKLKDALVKLPRESLGPNQPGRRVALLAAAGIVLLLAVVPATYRIRASATLEGTVQRVIVAPIDGFVGETRARAGDIVAAGEILGALDDSEQLLERRKWQSKHDQLAKEYRAALAEHERSQVTILSAQLAQTRAELALLDEHLSRVKLVAPFDGVVARGDLSQRLGSPVERGEVLFEVAPLDSYRVILEVDERDIGDVAIDQPGQLTLSALPQRPLPLRVERITPIATAADGRNHFRVEARLEDAPGDLRPGMEGVGKIEAGRRRLLWIWTHGLVDWLRLWSWSWLP